jgi:hypothetical protein
MLQAIHHQSKPRNPKGGDEPTPAAQVADALQSLRSDVDIVFIDAGDDRVGDDPVVEAFMHTSRKKGIAVVVVLHEGPDRSRASYKIDPQASVVVRTVHDAPCEVVFRSGIMYDDATGLTASPLPEPDEQRLSKWPPFSETGHAVISDATSFSATLGFEGPDLEALLAGALRSNESAVVRSILRTDYSAEQLIASMRDDDPARPNRESDQLFQEIARSAIEIAAEVAKGRYATYISASDVLLSALTRADDEWPAISLINRGLTPSVVIEESMRLPRKLK